MKVVSVDLGSVATIVAGQSPPGSSYNDKGNGLPFFQGKAEFGEIYPTPVKWCTAPTKLAEAGDILISVRAPVGPTNLAAERCCIGRGLAAIRPNSNKTDARFIHWALIAARSTLERKGNGSTFAAINRNDLASLRIPLPPLDEQRRIVGLLDRAAEIRRRADAARAKVRAIIPALFLDMFGDPATNPKAWRVEPLGSHVMLSGGGTPSKSRPEFWGGSIPWVSPKDMKPAIISDSEDKITEEAMTASPVRMIPQDSILIVVRGMILAHTVPIRMNSIAVTLNQDMKALVPKQPLNPTFLRWLLQSAHDYLLGKVRESAHGTKKLETAVLTAFPAMLPPLPLQTAFAGQAQRIEATARALDAAAAKAEAMAAGLSAEVFGSA